ncbi:unnamed protein product, partial [Prorocentrum cordatum]
VTTEDLRARWAILIQAVFAVITMFDRNQRYKVIDSFLSRQFPAMQILCQDKTVDSFIPDARTGSRTRMSCYPDLNKTCCHPTNGEHEYTVPAGRFKECLYCGTVWKGEKYQIRAKDVIFWNLHGTRETPGGSQLTTGQAKRYYGMAKSAYNNLQLEKRVYERRMQKSRFLRRQRRGFDIYEIFAGECGIALHAADRANGWGMRALQPVDKLFGQGLKKQKARKVLEDLRDEERCFITFTKDIFDKQKDYGNHALLENPATADSWREEAIVKLRQDNYECTSNMCMFGMVGNQGLPMKKLVRWLGTHPLLIQELDRHCDHSHPHEDVQGGGPDGKTKLSQVYTWQLADAICRGLTRVIESEEFGHGIYLCSYYPVSYDAPALTVHHVCYSAPDMDETKWKNIMQSVVDVMSRRNAPSAQVAQDSEMWRQVSELVPWQILYMQAAFQPPTHHESDFKTQYDTVCSLSDALQSAKYQHHLDHQSKANHDSQYQYPTNHSQTNFSLSLSNNGLATMHQNLSHPLQADFTRFLNASDASQIPYMGSVNARVGLDFFYLPDSALTTHQFLGILEMSGLLMVVVHCPTRDPIQVLEIFNLAWLSWAGYPDHVVCDRDGAFQAAFVEHLEAHDVHVEKPPAETHWQSGRVEANITLWKHMAKKVIDTMQLAGVEGMKLMAPAINQSRNSRVRQCGASPYQWTFGKDPRIPDSITDPANSAVVHSAMTADAELAKRARVRALADMAFTEYDRSESLKRAMLRVNRPYRGDYAPGDRVAFWRQAKNKKGKQYPARFIVATVVGPGGSGGADDNNVWVQSSGHPILVSKEQLREAHGTELWIPDEEDMTELRKATQAPPERFHDERAVPPSEIDPNDVIVSDLAAALRDEGGREHVRGLLPPPAQPPAEPLQLTEASGSGDNMTDNILPAVRPLPEDAVGDTRAARRPRFAEPETPTTPPTSQAPGATYACFNGTEHNSAIPIYMCEQYTLLESPAYEVYLNNNGSFTMTKKDQKALIREIPYSQIPADQLLLFREALAREWSSWQRFSAVEVLDSKTSKSIESDPEKKKRIIPSRVCYRDKNAGRGVSEIDAKARIVGIGYNDPDIMTLRRDAPTLTRAVFYILLQAISSWDFNLFGGDVTTAFLQADQTKAQRDKPIYLRQPSEGLPGIRRGVLLLVRRAIYGFVNSPRLWWRELRDFLMHIGGKQCFLDKALFCFYNKSHRIIMIIGIHVDDLIGGADAREGSKLLETIRQRFTFGKWWDNKLTYCGKHLSNNENGAIFINQKEFCSQCICDA